MKLEEPYSQNPSDDLPGQEAIEDPRMVFAADLHALAGARGRSSDIRVGGYFAHREEMTSRAELSATLLGDIPQWSLFYNICPLAECS